MRYWLHTGLLLSVVMLFAGCAHHPRLKVVRSAGALATDAAPLPGNGLELKRALAEATTVLVVDILAPAAPVKTDAVTLRVKAADSDARVAWTTVRQRATIGSVLKSGKVIPAGRIIATYEFISQSSTPSLARERALLKGEQAILFLAIDGHVIKILLATEENLQRIRGKGSQ